MKEIKINGNEYTVSDNTYLEIINILNAGKVCQHCDKEYSAHNVQVCANTCAQCFLTQHPDYTYLDCSSEAYPYGDNRTRTTSRYLNNKDHYIYSIEKNGSCEPWKLQNDTLNYYGFTQLPRNWMINGKEEYISNWSIVGDFTKDSILLAHCYISYWSSDSNGYGQKSKEVTLIMFKNGVYFEFNKRSKLIREMAKEAETKLNAVSSWHNVWQDMAELVTLMNQNTEEVKKVFVK
jgi:hypothetical protein